uniref:HK97 family phage prohead protease n=1 Tax=Alloyangia mangrovi TaxID=1779329 RepID=A0A2A3JSZ6_9RHOB
MELEHKFCQPGGESALGITLSEGLRIEGYASLFGKADQGGDIVEPGAYAASLQRLASEGRAVRLLWQHDPAQPIGVWEELREDGKGLYVRGRLLEAVEKGREAAALLAAGAIDGLSIGYRTVTAVKDREGRRLLKEVELWEVSLVTFPMLPNARVAAKGESPDPDALRELALALDAARRDLAGD